MGLSCNIKYGVSYHIAQLPYWIKMSMKVRSQDSKGFSKLGVLATSETERHLSWIHADICYLFSPS